MLRSPGRTRGHQLLTAEQAVGFTALVKPMAASDVRSFPGGANATPAAAPHIESHHRPWANLGSRGTSLRAR